MGLSRLLDVFGPPVKRHSGVADCSFGLSSFFFVMDMGVRVVDVLARKRVPAVGAIRWRRMCVRQRKDRRGVATLELILVIPILLIVLVVSFQFGMIALYQAAVTHSATVAAREAGKGANLGEVKDAVQRVVDVHGIDINGVSGSGAKVTLDDLAPNEVRVTVCVDLAATQFCDALVAWGLSFAGQTLRASSLVTKELEQDASTP